MNIFDRQIKIFLFVGFATVGVDYFTYTLLLSVWPENISVSKGFGYFSGVLFAYFCNRFWTFRKVQHPKLNGVMFGLLYSLTLFTNVSINLVVLIILTDMVHSEKIAFLLATGTTAVMNFLGMKLIVFNVDFWKSKV